MREVKEAGLLCSGHSVWWNRVITNPLLYSGALAMSGILLQIIIMEYGSTPYVGMAREKNGGPI